MKYLVIFHLIILTVFSSLSAKSEISLHDHYLNMKPSLMEDDWHIHDPSRVINFNQGQLIAVTGKAQEDGYKCGLELWFRENISSDWQPYECLFINKPNWIKDEVPDNDGAFWAPEIINEKKILYSVASNFEDGEVSCTALAVKNEISDEWVDSGEPLTCTNKELVDYDYESIDPSFIVSPNGKTFLITGGGLIHGTQVDPKTFRPLSGDWFSYEDPSWKILARGPKIEDEFDWVEASYIYFKDDFYYLFVNWGSCCRGVESDYNIRVGRSRNPLGPFLDKKGLDLSEGGGSLVLKSEENIRGPGHASIWIDNKGYFLAFHYYDSNRDGMSFHGEYNLLWVNGWPKINH